MLYSARHLVTHGRVELTVDVPSAPAYVVVDPFVRRIDRDRSDNTKRIATGQ